MINTALLPADKDPMGAAIADYFKRHKADRLRVFSSQFDEDEIPVEELFRTEKQMPLLERTALQMATGKILDVGAGSGCHSLTLQEAGKEVHAIDISPLSVEVMKQRGVRSVSQTNLFNEQFADEYDTILMLMNGSGTHPHKNMEIISIPLKGKLKHGDSHQNSRVITPGDIQTMSAGTGIYHSEMNGSDTEAVEFLQIWVMPEKLNTPPAYQDFDVRPLLRKNEMALIVSPDGDAPARLLQQTWFSIGEIEAGKKIDYHMHQSHSGVYIFVMEGEVKVDGTILSRRDGMGVYETGSFELETLKDSHILFIEVPM
jgi:quercetin 2,3-dioxygenase